MRMYQKLRVRLLSLRKFNQLDLKDKMSTLQHCVKILAKGSRENHVEERPELRRKENNHNHAYNWGRCVPRFL